MSNDKERPELNRFNFISIAIDNCYLSTTAAVNSPSAASSPPK